MSEVVENDNVHKAIARVMAEIEQVPKTQENAHAGYMFASRDDVVGMLRPLLSKHGITFRLHKHEVANRYTAVYTSTADPESFVEFNIDGVGCKPGQKQDGTPQNYGGAISYVEKYAHRVMFMIDTGDASEDPDANDPQGGGKDDSKPKPDPKPDVTDEQREAKEECTVLADELGMEDEERRTEFLRCERDYIRMRDVLRGRVKAASMLADHVVEDKENAKKAGEVK